MAQGVEQLVGRKVIAFTSGVEPDGEITTEVFLLEPERPRTRRDVAPPS